MNVLLIADNRYWLGDFMEALAASGAAAFANMPEGYPDAVVLLDGRLAAPAAAALAHYPHARPFAWHEERYPLHREEYAAWLDRCAEVWAPSRAERERLARARPTAAGRCRVLYPPASWWERPRPRDSGYALCTHGPGQGRFLRACEEMGLPAKTLSAYKTRYRHQRLLSGCRLLVSPHRGAGDGESILEGLYLGKPVLASDSSGNPAREYLRDLAVTFRHEDEDHFRQTLREAWESPPAIDRSFARSFARREFSPAAFAARVLSRLSQATARGDGATPWHRVVPWAPDENRCAPLEGTE